MHRPLNTRYINSPGNRELTTIAVVEAIDVKLAMERSEKKRSQNFPAGI